MKKLITKNSPSFALLINKAPLPRYYSTDTQILPEAWKYYHRNGKPVTSYNAEEFKKKPTTGLVGLPVQLRWREMLVKLTKDVLVKVRKEIPEGVYFRQVVENNFEYIQRVASNLELD